MNSKLFSLLGFTPASRTLPSMAGKVIAVRMLAAFAIGGCFVAASFQAAALAQDPNTLPPLETSEKPAGSGDPALADYDAAVAELREQMIKLREIWVRYQISENGQEMDLKEEFRLGKIEGHKRMDRVRDAALSAFLKDPVKYANLGKFLSEYLTDCFEDDRFDEGVRNAAVKLAESGFPGEGVQIMAGVTSFAANEFQEAKKWLEIAAQSGDLGPIAQAALDDADSLTAKWEKELAEREKEAAADDLPRVLVRTNKGNFTLELFEDHAPGTVGNFISLVESNFYDGLTFHRVLEHFMAQGGCPNGDGMGGPDYSIKGEADRPDHRCHFRGSIAMALSNGPDTGGSQFYVCFYPAPQLDGKYTVFGRVIEGMEIFSDIARVNVNEEKEGEKKQPDTIINMEVLRKRDHKYEPIIAKQGN